MSASLSQITGSHKQPRFTAKERSTDCAESSAERRRPIETQVLSVERRNPASRCCARLKDTSNPHLQRSDVCSIQQPIHCTERDCFLRTSRSHSVRAMFRQRTVLPLSWTG